MASRGDQIAERIRKHLERFEGNKKINQPVHRIRPYYHIAVWRAGRYIGVSYVSWRPDGFLAFDKAEAYADWLDAGNVGKHWEMEES